VTDGPEPDELSEGHEGGTADSRRRGGRDFAGPDEQQREDDRDRDDGAVFEQPAAKGRQAAGSWRRLAGARM
jgi:hypothetical protein